MRRVQRKKEGGKEKEAGGCKQKINEEIAFG